MVQNKLRLLVLNLNVLKWNLFLCTKGKDERLSGFERSLNLSCFKLQLTVPRFSISFERNESLVSSLDSKSYSFYILKFV